MKILIYLIGIVLLIGLISAQAQTLGTFQKGICVSLKQLCASCSYSKITSVTYPDQSIALGNADMSTTDSIEYNYTFCNTTQLGQYIVNGYADVDSTDTAWVYDFNIAPQGFTQEVSNTGLNYIGTIILMVVAMIIGLFVYKFFSKPIGGLIIFLLGIGIMYKAPANAWIGMLVMPTGFVMMLIGFFSHGKKRR